MDTARLGRGEMIAAVSAIVLLVVMFLFNWFGYDVGGEFGGLAEEAGVDTSVGFNAWESFGFIDLILFVTILVAAGVAVMAANAQSVNLPVAGSALVAGLGILSVILILFRIIVTPSDSDREVGVFIGLIAAGGIAYGGFLGMQEEGTSFRDQGDRLQTRGPTDPPPPAAGGGTPPPAV